MKCFEDFSEQWRYSVANEAHKLLFRIFFIKWFTHCVSISEHTRNILNKSLFSAFALSSLPLNNMSLVLAVELYAYSTNTRSTEPITHSSNFCIYPVFVLQYIKII